MKLKQRVTLGAGLAGTVLVIFMLPALLDSPTDLLKGQINGMFIPGHARMEKGLDPDEVRGNVVDDIKGHLNVFRKDLDVSNYTSNTKDKLSHEEYKSAAAGGGGADVDHQSNNNLNLRLPLNLPESELMEFVLKDKAIASNADKLIRIARVLEHSRRSNGIIPANLTKEFVPDKGDVVLPGGVYHDLDIKYDWERRKIPANVVLSESVEQELEQIVRKLSVIHEKKRGRRKAARMKIYDDAANLTSWQRWHNTITQFNLYPGSDSPDAAVVDNVILDLRTLEFTELYQHEGGTQLKIVYYLENDGRAMFKPMRYPRDVETLPDHFYFSDYERHTGEIAAFHLDREMGFYRVPPTTGRLINVTHDVKRMADAKLLKTFFVSPAGNVCFHGECTYYCDTGHAVCGRTETMEGSFAAYLPITTHADRIKWRHPWRRSYHKRKKAEWETNNNYCYQVRDTPPYNTGRRLLDLMDMSAFDFLQGNLDRHHYETFEDFGNYTFTMHLDNGRGFGKSLVDDLSIMAPIYQCCLFRYSTLDKLFRFHRGPQHLSDVMRAAMASDPVAPVLLERHLLALDRRVNIILKTVYKCVAKNGLHKVVVDDGF